MASGLPFYNYAGSCETAPLIVFCVVQMRSVLGGLTISVSHLELFLVVKTFPNLEQGIGEHATFWLYAGTL
jgi:hypothetical protein